MNDTEIPNLGAVIYDLVKAADSTGGLNNQEIYRSIRDNIIPGTPITNIDATIDWLRHEGMLSASGDRWRHLPLDQEGEAA